MKIKVKKRATARPALFDPIYSENLGAVIGSGHTSRKHLSYGGSVAKIPRTLRFFAAAEEERKAKS